MKSKFLKLSAIAIVVVALLSLGFFSACEEKEYPKDIKMEDFSIRYNSCYYYNHIDTYNNLLPDSLITFDWDISNIDSNIVYVINSQQELLNYISIREGKISPIVDFNRYSLIMVRVSSIYNLGKPNKKLENIADNTYRLIFNCSTVVGHADIGEKGWVQAMLIQKIISNSNITFKLNITEM